MTEPLLDPKNLCINSDPFWPSIDLDSVRQQLCLDARVSDARLEVAVISAVIAVNREFGQWRRTLKEKGYGCLEQLRGEPEDDVPALVRCYFKAVTARTALALDCHIREIEQQPHTTAVLSLDRTGVANHG